MTLELPQFNIFTFSMALRFGFYPSHEIELRKTRALRVLANGTEGGRRRAGIFFPQIEQQM